MDITGLMDAVQTLNAEDRFSVRLTPGQWSTFAPYLTRHEVRGGDLLIRQADADRTLYLLERGSLQVFVTGVPAGAMRVAILRGGAVVGEAALFSNLPRMANVEAMTSSVLWALTRPRFDELCARLPTIALEVMRAGASVLAVRMRAALERSIAVS